MNSYVYMEREFSMYFFNVHLESINYLYHKFRKNKKTANLIEKHVYF